MELEKFIENFANQFDDTDVEDFTAETEYQHLDEWSSLIVLAIMNMINKKYNIDIDHEEVTNSNTIKELFEVVNSKA